MSDIAIRVEDLGKEYSIVKSEGKAAYKTLREAISEAVSAPLHWFGKNGSSARESIWALNDVSFEVRKGEVVGIIGRNGAGKSTLLKILSRITEPTKGSVDIYGRVGSLLEVGTGFHPELTGRENIYLNGAILGMKRLDIAKKFDEMVGFAEMEKHIDTPVKHYSSGMYLRLAFAVAANLNPDILLVDEVLAVGDAEFQKKCLGKMNEGAKQGRTVLFVSHNLGQIRTLCNEGILLGRGRVLAVGSVNNVIVDYQRRAALAYDGVHDEGDVGITTWRIRGSTPSNVISKADAIALEIGLKINVPVYNGYLTIVLGTDNGREVCAWQFNGVRIDRGTSIIDCHIPSLPVRPGIYYWNIALWDGGKKVDARTLYPELIVSTVDHSGLKEERESVLNIPATLRSIQKKP